MDLNGDGHMDILSGTYSRMDKDMAGTFQVLWGNEDGEFAAAKELKGTDDEPLIIPATEEEMTEKICTRPTAADINGDGHLDLIVGNFSGSFYLFHGEGEGKFNPKPEQIMAGESPLMVKHHSDPFVVDWDGDGDYDIVSGSDSGGAYLSINEGSKVEAKFSQMIELVAGVERNYEDITLGDEHINGPQSSTRVWVDDLNGDGKLDLLIGDSVSLMYPAEGVDEDEIDEKLEAWGENRRR